MEVIGERFCKHLSLKLLFTVKNSYDQCKALSKNQTFIQFIQGLRDRRKDDMIHSYFCEYCHKPSSELAKDVSTIIDPHYADSVDMLARSKYTLRFGGDIYMNPSDAFSPKPIAHRK
ncbi:unnamed protein product [Thlaspi arvense]|uniref:Uncharacterized protein n=1 Tax=Thlaspi arvense TaxID=13288 RepID=A0AAU9SNC1_THLAR|nr:unnamed protein product [Thlaspi arvense]